MTAHDTHTNDMAREGKLYVQEDTFTTAETRYYALRPDYYTMITIKKGGDTATMALTGGHTVTAGVVGNVDSETFGGDLSTGTTDYQKGHQAGFTGCEVTVSAHSAGVFVQLTQYKIED